MISIEIICNDKKLTVPDLGTILFNLLLFVLWIDLIYNIVIGEFTDVYPVFMIGFFTALYLDVVYNSFFRKQEEMEDTVGDDE